MGTNYYMTMRTRCPHPCAEHCRGPRFHLGKASMGWAFIFRAYPDGIPGASGAPQGISGPVTDWEAWRALLDLDGVVHDDTGQPVSTADLLNVIAHHSGGRTAPARRDHLDNRGRVFVSEEFS